MKSCPFTSFNQRLIPFYPLQLLPLISTSLLLRSGLFLIKTFCKPLFIQHNTTCVNNKSQKKWTKLSISRAFPLRKYRKSPSHFGMYTRHVISRISQRNCQVDQKHTWNFHHHLSLSTKIIDIEFRTKLAYHTFFIFAPSRRKRCALRKRNTTIRGPYCLQLLITFIQLYSILNWRIQ